jgi:hypothetical protein
MVRLVGWLLTPLVAWAASFAGAWLGARIAGSFKSSTTGAYVVVAFGAAFGIVAAWAWLHYLRQSPRLQKTLEVAPDGTPLAAVTDDSPREEP